jgi:hypothetical protein
MYPDLLGFELATMLGDPVSTAGNGVITDPDAATIPVGATRHVWTAPYGRPGCSRRPRSASSATPTRASSSRPRAAAPAPSSLDTPASGGVSLKASGPALYLARISDPSAHPDLRGADRRAVRARALHALDVAREHRRDRRRHDRHGAGHGRRSHPRHRLEVPRPARARRRARVIVTGSIPKRQIDADDYDALLAATGFAVKIRWQSTVTIGATVLQVHALVRGAQRPVHGRRPRSAR